MTFPANGQLTPLVTAEFLRTLEERVDVPSDRPQLAIVAPFTQDEIGSVPIATADDVGTAVDRARRVGEQWAALPVDDRARIVGRFHDLLIDRADLAIDLVQLEAGKARIPAMEEVYDAVATARYYLNTAPRLLKRQRRAVAFPGFSTAWEYRHPRGVVGFIVPWNFPFTLGISDAIPALLAGNGAVIKPDEKTPYSTLMTVKLLEEVGLPEGLIQVVTGPGEDIGPPLIDAVDFLMFTGSTEVGRIVAERAGRNLISASMELGGKNAAIVMADVDLDKAIPGISRSVFANGGQLCIAMERIYVDNEISDEFTTRFVDHVRSLPLSDSYDFSSALSGMITAEHVDNVHRHVEDAVERGATLLTGGKPRPDVGPTFYEPTVLTDVDESMMVCRAETFGPVVSIYGVDGVEQAIEKANDSSLGLNFSVWTRDTRRGVEVAARLEAGTVGVNDGYAAAWSTYDAPMGGWKTSGVSRRHGEGGLLKYTEAQTVVVQRGIDAFAPFPGMGYQRYQKVLGPLLKILRRLPFYK